MYSVVPLGDWQLSILFHHTWPREAVPAWLCTLDRVAGSALQSLSLPSWCSVAPSASASWWQTTCLQTLEVMIGRKLSTSRSGTFRLFSLTLRLSVHCAGCGSLTGAGLSSVLGWLRLLEQLPGSGWPLSDAASKHSCFSHHTIARSTIQHGCCRCHNAQRGFHPSRG